MWTYRLTINGTVHYLADEVVVDSRLPAVHWNGVVQADEVRLATAQVWGGFVDMEFGSITLRPDVFQGADWPPPLSCSLAIWYLGQGSTSSYQFAECTAHLVEISRTGVVYRLIGTGQLAATETDKAYKGTLLDVIFDAVAAAFPTVLMVNGGARSPSPNVDYLASGTNRIIDNLAAMAAFHAHRLVYAASTLYLVDHATNFGTSLALTEGDYSELVIEGPPTWSRYEAEYTLRDCNLYQLRPLASSSPSTTTYAIAEVKIQVASGDDKISPTAAGALSYTTGHPPGHAIDANAATYWQGNKTTGQYIEWSTGKRSITSYSITPRTDSLSDAPTEWELVLNDHNVTPGSRYYRSLGIITQREAWAVGAEQTFSVGEHKFATSIPSTAITGGDPLRISPVCATAYADIYAALFYIRTPCQRRRIRVTMPLQADDLPRVGQYVTVAADSGLPVATPLWFRIDEILYNLAGDTCTISGGGGYL